MPRAALTAVPGALVAEPEGIAAAIADLCGARAVA
jgi:hypothetical protein